MGIYEAVKKVNEGGGLEFTKNREKGEFDTLLNRPVTIENIAILDSRFYEGKENAVFTVEGDAAHFYRTGGETVVAQLKDLQEGLDEDGLDWDVLTLTFQQVRSKQGRRYYVVKAQLKPEVEAQLAERASQEAEAENIPL
ncbi:hypothetical protein E308F_18030 [Moorella sp. E308F]|uniref:hypothetical protein n=1 Tax=unclassified Neomoorella TaxID=2676739 RepID=UPI0010FFB37B|nr:MULTISPECIES: hypothetical protein [unclassified Moorella (in: firmicutes)]GEA15559.1 hypothetical protein E308F_18030 [Moorella sp. E308F]GEA19583.1 hypothetical protein E306M_27210 [Moorella sp. E306M]